MSLIPQVAQALQTVLTTDADAAAKKTGFVQRESKLTGSAFAQTLVFGWLSNPEATLEELAQTAGGVGVPITAQGLDQRFTCQAAALLHLLLEAAVHHLIHTDPVALPLLQRFSGVCVQDSSTVGLPPELGQIWPGGGQEAAVKLQVRVDLLTGQMTGPLLQPAQRHDRSSPLQQAPLPKGALRLADLGYFSLDVFQQIQAQKGFFLSRLQVQTRLLDPAGVPLDLPAFLAAQSADEVDRPILLGITHRLKARLLAVRVAPEIAQQRRRDLHRQAQKKGQAVSQARLALCDWTILVTNVPPWLVTLPEALVLHRIRWQVELLFKLWKSHGHLDKSRSSKSWRILCEVYAKLLGCLIQHWVFLVSCWSYPNRSLVKARKAVQRYALHLACVVRSFHQLCESLAFIQKCLQNGCRVNKRKKAPAAYQLLENPYVTYKSNSYALA